MSYQIFDNFLLPNEFNQVKNTVCDPRFPWGYSSSITTEVSTGPYDFQFVHMFYQNHRVMSEHFESIYPLINKINPAAISRVKANLVTRNPVSNEFGYHTDFEDAELLKSAVYYLDTTDGVTRFEDGTEVECIENRLLVFNNNMPHTSTSCTDQKVRRVINLNYYELI